MTLAIRDGLLTIHDLSDLERLSMEPGLGSFVKGKYVSKELLRRLKKKKQLLMGEEGIVVLDIMSGANGSDFVNWYTRSNSGSLAIYLDNSQEALDALRFRNGLLGDARDIPLEDDRVDIAYCNMFPNGISIQEDSHGIVREARRVVNENGYFVFTLATKKGECTKEFDGKALECLYATGFENVKHLERLIFDDHTNIDTYSAR